MNIMNMQGKYSFTLHVALEKNELYMQVTLICMNVQA